MTRQHRKPILAFVVLAVLTALLIGDQFRSDAGVPDLTAAERTAGNAVVRDASVRTGHVSGSLRREPRAVAGAPDRPETVTEVSEDVTEAGAPAADHGPAATEPARPEDVVSPRPDVRRVPDEAEPVPGCDRDRARGECREAQRDMARRRPGAGAGPSERGPGPRPPDPAPSGSTSPQPPAQGNAGPEEEVETDQGPLTPDLEFQKEGCAAGSVPAP